MKLLIRTGLALALGFGALAAAPKMALATPPCPSNCNSDCGNCGSGPWVYVDEWTSTDYACVNCDQDCSGEFHHVHAVNWTCPMKDISPVEGPPISIGGGSCQTKQPAGPANGPCTP